MAVSADCRISLSAPSCLRGSSGLTRHIKLGKFCNGELMGKKLNLSQLRSSSTNSSKKKIQMSLTSVTGETKVQEIESEKRDPRTVASIILGGGAGTRLFPLTKRGDMGLEKIMISILCLCVLHGRRASDFGLMKIDEKGRVISFSEKPKGDDLKAMAVDTTILGLSKEEAEKKPYIASMGVYVFKKEILLNLLRWRFPTANDFGSEIIPFSAKEFYVNAYLFNDYWEDIGTIRSFFEANLALTEHPPAFSFYDAAKPIYTSRRNLPPSKIDGSKLIDSIISHGSFLTNCLVEHSIVGIRSRIGSNVQLKDTVMLGADFYETEAEVASLLAEGKDTVMLGADFYETEAEVASLLAEGKVPIGIGENTKIKECIIDKNARVGKNVIIANSEGVQEADRSSDGFYIRSGITVILKNSVIRDGAVI
ncbi:hypothetical protein F2Q68_00022366 [Brassica cretica]|uniref:glucose-1-phosphate adenylyltransferase n=1 Tax=Brassica cretica TaxID=69181 RepID=A0A8S9FQS0_BRACR|nr:hypothetical protein F2Q68_00022366 [Brassica cretica]